VETKPKTRVIGYIRVSTSKQANEGWSLDAQLERLRAYAIAVDLVLVDIVIDAGLSAKSLNRPGIQQALSRLEAGEASGLLIVKLDRLTRSVKDLGILIERYFEKRFQLLSVTDAIDTRSASGVLVLNVLMSVAQWERQAIGERTKAVLEHLKSEGVRLGGEALGWRHTEETDEDGRRVIAPVEAEERAVSRAVELRGEGLSFRAVAAKLSEEGFETKRGGRWAAETVRKIVNRAA
jgi:site-specific DNA recombinase